MEIPPVKIIFSEEEKKEIKDKIDEVLSSGFLTLGKYCKEFENKFSEYVGTRYGAATSSGTSAIEIIIRSLGLKNSEIIVPTNTFFATPAAVLHSGNKVKFVDCDESLCVTEETIKKGISDETKAAIIVHIGGNVVPETEQIKRLCQEKELFLIEDASHAHGSELNDKKAGTFGDAAAISFFATKVMTSAEGGMILTNNKKIYENSLILRDQGKMGSRNFHTQLGYNWRMSEIHAIIGLSQLKKLDEVIKQRRKIARIYDAKLQNIGKIVPLRLDKNNVPNYYKYVCFTKDISREEIKNSLKEKWNISLPGEVYEKPCHLQPVFKNLNYKKGDFPVAEKACKNHICLPLYDSMDQNEVDYVIHALKEEIK